MLRAYMTSQIIHILVLLPTHVTIDCVLPTRVMVHHVRVQTAIIHKLCIALNTLEVPGRVIVVHVLPQGLPTRTHLPTTRALQIPIRQMNPHMSGHL